MSDEARRAGAIAIARRLRDHGFEAYLVGGCVRDLLLGREPEDFDLVTSARPEEVQALFSPTIPVGAKFGVIIVIMAGHEYEVATFRREEGYEDGRHPSRVTYGTLREDVRRRDFTVNGLAMVPETGEIIDYVGGREDIERRVIRAIGSPAERFAEDHLRMMRAVRFAAQLGLTIDHETFTAIAMRAPAIQQISAERVRDELTKMITRPGDITASSCCKRAASCARSCRRWMRFAASCNLPNIIQKGMYFPIPLKSLMLLRTMERLLTIGLRGRPCSMIRGKPRPVGKKAGRCISMVMPRGALQSLSG